MFLGSIEKNQWDKIVQKSLTILIKNVYFVDTLKGL